MSYIVSAVESIAAHLHPGLLVVLESTTYPGATEEVVQPLLERAGLKAGVDFFLAFSPERVDPGNGHYTTRNVPKVVGGTTPTCGELARALYSVAIDTVVPVSSPRVAEMVKLLENTFRAVNIGLVNEMALMCDKLEHRRLGSHRCGENQAVRLHAVLSRPRPGRTLHPDRSDSICRGRRSRAASSRGSSSWLVT